MTSDKRISIVADTREKSSKILRLLYEKEDVLLQVSTLPQGDFALSDHVVVEYKQVNDFVGSILDGRLLEQLKKLTATIFRPLVVVEGEQSIYSVRNINPQAITGMLATISVTYGVSVLFTRTPEETANLFYTIAKRQQIGGVSSYSPHASNKPASFVEQQEYVISALPDVGLERAKKLLKHFRSVQRIINATQEELQSVDGIGAKTALRIVEFVRRVE